MRGFGYMTKYIGSRFLENLNLRAHKNKHRRRPEVDNQYSGILRTKLKREVKKEIEEEIQENII